MVPCVKELVQECFCGNKVERANLHSRTMHIFGMCLIGTWFNLSEFDQGENLEAFGQVVGNFTVGRHRNRSYPSRATIIMADDGKTAVGLWNDFNASDASASVFVGIGQTNEMLIHSLQIKWTIRTFSLLCSCIYSANKRLWHCSGVSSLHRKQAPSNDLTLYFLMISLSFSILV